MTESGSTFEFDDADAVINSDIWDTHHITTMDFSFSDRQEEASARLVLTSSRRRSSLALFKGKDANWINGSSEKLSILVKAIAPQNQVYSKWKIIFWPLLALSSGALINFVFSSFLNLFIEPFVIYLPKGTVNIPRFMFYCIRYLLFFFSGIGVSLWFDNYAAKLWPDIEFQVGPEYLQREKHRRNVLNIVCAVALFPLLVSICYDLIKPKIFGSEEPIPTTKPTENRSNEKAH